MKVIRDVSLALVFFLLFSPVKVKAANSYDLSDTNNFNQRIDGQAWHDHIPGRALRVADLNSDGVNDYILGSIGSDYGGSHTGSLFIIDGTILPSVGIGRTVDLLGTPAKYSLRIDHTVVNSYYPYDLEVADFNNDGKPDIVVADPSGGAFVIFNDLLTNYSGIGNTRTLDNSANYSIRYSGYSTGLVGVADFDADNRPDLVLGSSTNFQASGAGSVFIFFNQTLNDTPSGTTLSLSDSDNYDLRIDGAAASDAFGTSFLRGLGDINQDGKDELGVSARGYDNGNGAASGSLYLFSGDFLTSYKSSGSNFSVADDSSYNVRLDGTVAPDYLGLQGFDTGDINKDGKEDLFVGSAGFDSWTGAVYLICGDSLSGKFTSFNNVLEMSETSNYNKKFLGISAGDNFGDYSMRSTDFNNDSYDDLFLGASMTDIDGDGEIYVIYGSAGFCDVSAQEVAMSNSSNYDVLYTGPSGMSLGYTSGVSLQDVDLDGSTDILACAILTGYNSRAESGSLYTILNFPHTITLTSTGKDQIIGTVSGANSVAAVAGVQYSYSNSPLPAAWRSCAGTTAFTCTLTDFPSGSSNNVYIRAFDANGSYTAQSAYAAVSFRDSNSAGPGDPNCLPNYKYCITSGPHHLGGGYFLNSLGTQFFLSNTGHHDDVFTQIIAGSTDHLLSQTPKIPFPWEQGLNTAGDIFEVKVLSAFNGYPIPVLDSPATLILPYDRIRLTAPNIHPQNLRMAFYNQETKRWQIMPRNTVINQTNATLANTTKIFNTYFVVAYSSNNISPQDDNPLVLGARTADKRLMISPTPTANSSPTPKSASSTKKKHCFFFFCW